MHPQYTSDRPGTAPCCGMRLEPVYADGSTGAPAGGSGAAAMEAGGIHVSPEKQQLAGIRTGEVERASLRHTMRLLGRVAADQTRTYVVNAAVDGWIRQVFSPSTGSQVEKDEPLATFYSKDFLAAQQNYFYALNTLDRLKKSQFNSPEQLTLTNVQVWSQEDTLESLGMSPLQIQEIASKREYTRNVVIRAPVAGFILARNVTPGQRFERGDELYRVADLRHVWVLADVFENEGQYIKPGLKVPVSYRGRRFPATVSEVLPQFDGGSRTLKFRLEADNPGYQLRPDMFVDIEFPVTLPPSITVPIDAVIDSGLRKIVFVDRGSGFYQAREVVTGWRFGDRVEITSGLEPGERIVVSGNFLLDSETRMKAAAEGIQAPATDPVCGMQVDRMRAKAAGRTSEFKGGTYYFCADQCKQRFEKDPGAYVREKAAARNDHLRTGGGPHSEAGL